MNWTPEKSAVGANETNNRKAGVLAWKSLGLLVLGFLAYLIQPSLVGLETSLANPWLLFPFTMIPGLVFAIRAFRLFRAGEYPRPMLPPIALVLNVIGLLTTLYFSMIIIGLHNMH